MLVDWRLLLGRFSGGHEYLSGNLFQWYKPAAWYDPQAQRKSIRFRGVAVVINGSQRTMGQC
jgi:hypothetical protein